MGMADQVIGHRILLLLHLCTASTILHFLLHLIFCRTSNSFLLSRHDFSYVARRTDGTCGRAEWTWTIILARYLG
ncbi:hypothetical protein BX600DRAFT_461050, partial [Xylariales sp. PMI_506]